MIPDSWAHWHAWNSPAEPAAGTRLAEVSDEQPRPRGGAGSFTDCAWATTAADMAHQRLAAQLLRHFATSASEVARGLANDSLYINCSVTV